MLEPRGLIKKDNLMFVEKFIWIFLLHCLYLTVADNILMWDRAVLVASLVARFDIHFSRLLLAFFHARSFKALTTYPFLSLILSCAG